MTISHATTTHCHCSYLIHHLVSQESIQTTVVNNKIATKIKEKDSHQKFSEIKIGQWEVRSHDQGIKMNRWKINIKLS